MFPIVISVFLGSIRNSQEHLKNIDLRDLWIPKKIRRVDSWMSIDRVRDWSKHKTIPRIVQSKKSTVLRRRCAHDWYPDLCVMFRLTHARFIGASLIDWLVALLCFMVAPNGAASTSTSKVVCVYKLELQNIIQLCVVSLCRLKVLIQLVLKTKCLGLTIA